MARELAVRTPIKYITRCNVATNPRQRVVRTAKADWSAMLQSAFVLWVC